ncbi:MAG: hypothetical protein V1746_05320, partial [bacterium]
MKNVAEKVDRLIVANTVARIVLEAAKNEAFWKAVEEKNPLFYPSWEVLKRYMEAELYEEYLPLLAKLAHATHEKNEPTPLLRFSSPSHENSFHRAYEEYGNLVFARSPLGSSSDSDAKELLSPYIQLFEKCVQKNNTSFEDAKTAALQQLSDDQKNPEIPQNLNPTGRLSVSAQKFVEAALDEISEEPDLFSLQENRDWQPLIARAVRRAYMRVHEIDEQQYVADYCEWTSLPPEHEKKARRALTFVREEGKEALLQNFPVLYEIAEKTGCLNPAWEEARSMVDSLPGPKAQAPSIPKPDPKTLQGLSRELFWVMFKDPVTD